MYTKDYFLSLIMTSFLTQIDIPLSLLQDEEAMALIIKHKWLININISNYDWATLVKGRVYRD